jgi:hypothetical protein
MDIVLFAENIARRFTRVIVNAVVPNGFTNRNEIVEINVIKGERRLIKGEYELAPRHHDIQKFFRLVNALLFIAVTQRR